MTQSARITDEELVKITTVELQKLELQPGDVLVVRVDRKLKPAALERFDMSVKVALEKSGLKDVPYFCSDKDVHFTKLKKAEGPNSEVNLHIGTIDSKEVSAFFEKNKEQIVSIVQENIERNGSLRAIIKG